MSPAVTTVARPSNRMTVTIAATITARFLLSAFPLGSMLFGASGEAVGPDATVGVWVRELTSIGMRMADELVGRVCSVTKNNNKFVNS